MRFGVREICDVVFKARTETKIGSKTFKKGQPVLYIDTAKTSTLEGAASTVYAQGGKGNPRLIAWEGERTITFTVEDALISPISFAMLSGAGLTNVADADSQNKIKVHTTFDLPILDGGVVKIDLDTAGDNHDIYYDEDIAPIFGTILDNAGAGVVFCQLDTTVGIVGPESNCGVYTITKDKALELTFVGAERYVGKTMRVDLYTEKTGGATEITIDAENFAGNYYVEASTLFREQHTAKDMPAEIVFPNVKIQSNFTFSMANTGDPSTFTFTMDAFPDYTNFDKQHKVFAAIQIVGEENIHPDDPDEEKEEECQKLPIEVEEVTPFKESLWTAPGTTGVKDTPYWLVDGAPDTQVKNFKELGSYLKISIDRANVDFSGNLNLIDDWKAYSSNPNNLTGYYYPYTIKVPADTFTGGSITNVNPGGSIENPRVVNFYTGPEDAGHLYELRDDGFLYKNMVTAVDPNNPVVTMIIRDGQATGSGMTISEEEKDHAVEYSFDFSRCIFK